MLSDEPLECSIDVQNLVCDNIVETRVMFLTELDRVRKCSGIDKPGVGGVSLGIFLKFCHIFFILMALNRKLSDLGFGI